MAEPYYQDDLVTLYHGDCLEIDAWLTADVLVTDPPYGRDWKQGKMKGSDAHAGIQGDKDTKIRDRALTLWASRGPAVVFGDLMLPPPSGTQQVLIYAKPSNAGMRGTFAGFRRDAEAIYLKGWKSGLGGDSSILTTGARSMSNPEGLTGRYKHPHAKPVDLLETVIARCPEGMVADPFAGSGSTLVAARNAGRSAIGVELEERYCEVIAKRLDQMALFTGGA